jgi:curved DNA-binding protein CbpA
MARRCHPDGSTPDAKRMAALNGAYDRVKTADARSRYDAERSKPVAVGPGAATPTYDAWPDARHVRTATADDDKLDFGRYAGWKISDIARVDPDHLRWLSRHSTGNRFREAIVRYLPNDGDLGRRASAVR